MQENFLIQNNIIAAIQTCWISGRWAMLHHTDPKLLDAKMSDITITCKLLVISSLVQIENVLKINNLQKIMI